MFRRNLSRNVLATLWCDKLQEKFHSATYLAKAKIVARQVARAVAESRSKGAVTLGNFSCNLSRNFVATQVASCDTGCLNRVTLGNVSVILEAVVSSAAILFWNKTSRAQKEQFDWPMPLNVATQVAGKVLHCATWQKFLATLRSALRKVATIAATKKIRQKSIRVCYTRQYFVQLVSQQNCVCYLSDTM